MVASKNNANACVNTAIRLLARRGHSVAELRGKLKLRGFPAADIDNAVAACRRFDYLDDRRFAEATMLSLLRRGYGPSYIKRCLESKGVTQNIIEACLTQDACPASTEDQVEACLNLMHKRIGRAEGAEAADARLKARLYRYLTNRGFSAEAARIALQALENEGRANG